MNMTIRTLTCVAALAAFVTVFAQDEEETAEETAEESVEETKSEEKSDSDHISEINDKLFTILPFCKRLEGRAEVLVPGQQEWAKIDEGRFFPLGSMFRTLTDETRLEISFGREALVSIVGQASFGTRMQGLDVSSRTITLGSGTIELRLPLNFPEKMFCVTNEGFCVENPAGVSRYTYVKTGDGFDASVRCVSGVLTVRGPHFTIPAMHAANEVQIRSSKDFLVTRLLGKSGDFMCHLDAGLMEEMDYELNKSVIVEKSIDWKLSPRTAIRIFRKVPEIGKNRAVSILTFDSNGELKNRVSFTEGRHEVNTGDQGPATKKDRERAAKALEAAAATVETTTEEEPAEDSSAEEE